MLASLLLPFAACSSTPSAPSIGTSPSSGPKQPTPVGKTLQVYRGHEGNPVIWVAWAPDGKLVASAGMDLNMNLWEPTTGKMVRTYTGISGQMLWSRDGKLIVSCDTAGACHIWQLFSLQVSQISQISHILHLPSL